jgi:hypothetical protein
MDRLEALGAWGLIIAGLTLAVASVTSIGSAQSWDVADAFAADSMRGVRRAGMLLGAIGLAGLVAAAPVLILVTGDSAGASWIVGGWVTFAVGVTLFSMALGLAAIAMPALGELARTGDVSPQLVANQLTRQAPIMAAFLGGNLTFLSWAAIGFGLARSSQFPVWLGWVVAFAAVAGWLGFLHVPVFQRWGGPLWPLAVVLVGIVVLRLSRAGV